MSTDRKKKSVIDKEKTDASKKLDTEDKKQESHEQDADKSKAAIDNLKSAGTAEGHRARDAAVKRLDKNVKREATTLEKAEKQLSQEGQKVEKELDQTANTATADQKAAQDTAKAVKFKDAQSELKNLAQASGEDANFLNTTKRERGDRRKQSDDKTKQFAGKIKGMKINLKG